MSSYFFTLTPFGLLSQAFYYQVIVPLQQFFLRIFKPVESLPPPLTLTHPSKLITRDEKYIQKQTDRLLRSFSDTTTDYNENVDAAFYSKPDLLSILIEADNPLEKKWRSNLLFESTPRGNIIMFYDAYKQGFAYYADQTGIPYSILNAVSMKYVVIFRCRDFFIDETVLGNDHVSGITAALDSETRPQVITTERMPSMKPNGPFAKFKNYNSKTISASDKMNANSRKEVIVAPKQTNRHISLGKMSNYSFIKSPPVSKSGFDSNLLPKNQMSYLEFKQQYTVKQ